MKYTFPLGLTIAAFFLLAVSSCGEPGIIARIAPLPFPQELSAWRDKIDDEVSVFPRDAGTVAANLDAPVVFQAEHVRRSATLVAARRWLHLGETLIPLDAWGFLVENPELFSVAGDSWSIGAYHAAGVAAIVVEECERRGIPWIDLNLARFCAEGKEHGTDFVNADLKRIYTSISSRTLSVDDLSPMKEWDSGFVLPINISYDDRGRPPRSSANGTVIVRGRTSLFFDSEGKTCAQIVQESPDSTIGTMTIYSRSGVGEDAPWSLELVTQWNARAEHGVRQ